ncbi:MAG: 4-(cytidine 5'-diphospho)-2-C-methyl-D-erythritol kinase [Oscillospiraceae bacterium]|nr:4-(cytidine 5'-diphospho)-2-C-methyl-D-erythritol kinase [Oscillospiraceae bacterium]
MKEKSLTVSACAKLNLTLDVLGKRRDGYHDLRMVMQSVSLRDTVTLRATEGDFGLTTNLRYLPGADRNIAAVAARAFAEKTGVSLEGLRIDLDKRIPVCAGTAGGSSDAAAVLRGLNRWFGTGLTLPELAALGEEIGSDVPYCVWGTTALAEGRGEALTPLDDLPACRILLCKPDFSVSTPELFRQFDAVKLRFHPDTPGVRAALAAGDLTGVCRRMFNVFEQAMPPQRMGVIDEIKSTMLSYGALGACMSGTGPTVFGVFAASDGAGAEAARAELAGRYAETFLTHSVTGAQARGEEPLPEE